MFCAGGAYGSWGSYTGGGPSWKLFEQYCVHPDVPSVNHVVPCSYRPSDDLAQRAMDLLIGVGSPVGAPVYPVWPALVVGVFDSFFS